MTKIDYLLKIETEGGRILQIVRTEHGDYYLAWTDQEDKVDDSFLLSREEARKAAEAILTDLNKDRETDRTILKTRRRAK